MWASIVRQIFGVVERIFAFCSAIAGFEIPPALDLRVELVTYFNHTRPSEGLVDNEFVRCPDRIPRGSNPEFESQRSLIQRSAEQPSQNQTDVCTSVVHSS